jgi:class 3 adenylate cyclase
VSGERRHVTAMFCDLVDLTGIAAKLDAEEWRGLSIGAYLDAASFLLRSGKKIYRSKTYASEHDR